MAKSDKLYSKSPSLKRDNKSGKVGISRPTEADGEDMGVYGPDSPDNPDAEMPIQIHQTHEEAMTEMQDRHEQEMKDMHKRHQKDMSVLKSKAGKTGNEVIDSTKEAESDNTNKD